MRRAVASAKLDPVLREVVGLVVGVAVGNHYGIAFHSTVLGKLGFDESQITALRQGAAPANATVAAVSALARQVVLDRGKLNDAVLAEAMSAGLSAEAVLDVVLECAFATLVGLIDNLARHVELDAFLVPRAWPPAE